MISAAFAVRSVNGTQKLQAVGIAEIAVIPNIFLIPVAHIGTPLKPKENVPVANTNGETLRVLPAANGLRTRIGILRTLNSRFLDVFMLKIR